MSKRKSSPLGDLLGSEPRVAPPTPLPKEAPVEEEAPIVEEKVKPLQETSTQEVSKEGEGRKPKRGGKPREGLQRVRYDLPPEIKEAVDERAIETGIASSQMVAFLLAHAMHRFDKGELDPSPYFTKTKSPKFRHTLQVSFPLPPDDR